MSILHYILRFVIKVQIISMELLCVNMLQLAPQYDYDMLFFFMPAVCQLTIAYICKSVHFAGLKTKYEEAFV